MLKKMKLLSLKLVDGEVLRSIGANQCQDSWAFGLHILLSAPLAELPAVASKLFVLSPSCDETIRMRAYRNKVSMRTTLRW